MYNNCPFYYTALAVSEKVGIPSTVLTTQVRWLSSLQLTVLSRSAIVVSSKFLAAIFVLALCFFEFSVGARAFVIGLSQISSFFSIDVFYPWPSLHAR